MHTELLTLVAHVYVGGASLNTKGQTERLQAFNEIKRNTIQGAVPGSPLWGTLLALLGTHVMSAPTMDASVGLRHPETGLPSLWTALTSLKPSSSLNPGTAPTHPQGRFLPYWA